jgi:hypothetical protein
MSAEAVRAFSINIGASIGYWYVKTQIVKVPFLVAGGEDSISAGLGIRGLALRWSDAFVASLGFNSGAGVFYWADGTISVLSREPESLILSALIAILIILPFLSHRLGVRFSFIGQGEQVGDMRLRVAVYVAVIALLPGVTIVSRIEARWVFLSWIIVLVAATSQAIRISLRLTASLFILVLASVVNPNLTERWREIHVFPADRMVEEIRNTSPRSPADKNEWSLLYLNRRISGYWDTQEQKLFEMIPHRPLDIDFESTNCELKTCLLVVQYPAETDIVVLDPVHSRS